MSLASTFENFEDELGQILDHNCDGNFQSYFDEDLDLHDELETTFLETQTHLGFEQSMSDLIEEERKEFRYYIQSVVGDDEHITTNSKMLAPCLIGFGPIINGIKISWKDTGISKYIGNYAEGWILTPPSAEASFEATVRRHKISGVPFVLDPVKTKLLSPVRKQTSIEDNDLESKLSQLSEIASWTDSSWFTYDYHQMALLLSISIFDFQDANSFPFLYKAEGGCGGIPPYGNLDTAYSALHHYTRGKSHRAILGIMIEAVQVNLGQLKPQDTFFLKSARLANMGDQAWLRYISAYKSLQTSKVLSTGEINELLKDTEGSTLPPEILQLGAEVEPKNFAVGATIRALRKDGFIMSELDVKAAYDEKQREMALLGDKQIGLLKREQKEEWKLFKGNHMKILSKISENSPIIKESIKSKLGIIPTKPTDEHHDVLYTYYRLRSENYESFTSFHYTDSVRIFKTNEINDMLGHDHHQIRQDFAMTESFPKWKKKFLEENTDEKRRLTEIDEWIDSAPLDELLEKPFPPGIGTDDARIVRNIIDRISEHNLEAYEMIVVIMFSADRQLARTTAIQCSEWISAKVVVGQIDKAGYTAICLEGLSEWESLKARSELDVVGNPRMRIRGREREVKYYNYLLRRHWWIPTAALEEIIKRSDNPGYFRSRKSFLFHVEYDYPNMERGLDLIKYEPKTHSIREYGGGFLERRTLEGMGPDKCWAGKSYDEIKSWPDFDEHEVKRYYRRKKYFNDNRVTIVNPMNPATYNRIDYWKRNTFPNVLEIDNIQRQTITGP